MTTWKSDQGGTGWPHEDSDISSYFQVDQVDEDSDLSSYFKVDQDVEDSDLSSCFRVDQDDEDSDLSSCFRVDQDDKDSDLSSCFRVDQDDRMKIVISLFVFNIIVPTLDLYTDVRHVYCILYNKATANLLKFLTTMHGLTYFFGKKELWQVRRAFCLHECFQRYLDFLFVFYFFNKYEKKWYLFMKLRSYLLI